MLIHGQWADLQLLAEALRVSKGPEGPWNATLEVSDEISEDWCEGFLAGVTATREASLCATQ